MSSSPQTSKSEAFLPEMLKKKKNIPWILHIRGRHLITRPSKLFLLFSFLLLVDVPGHTRFSLRRVRQSTQSAIVSPLVTRASCGHPPDWVMSDISKCRRWGRIAGCGWGYEDLFVLSAETVYKSIIIIKKNNGI